MLAAKRAALLAIGWLCEPVGAQSDNQVPTPEQLRTFQINFDGEQRPDLVPLGLKVRDAINSYESSERLKAVFTPQDQELTNAFRSQMLSARQSDASMIESMSRDLCERIDQLDGAAVAAAMVEMDKIQFDLWDTRARAYLGSLGADAATAVRSEAEQLGRTIKGSTTDFVALARQYPDYVKQRIRDVCVLRGMLPK